MVKRQVLGLEEILTLILEFPPHSLRLVTYVSTSTGGPLSMTQVPALWRPDLCVLHQYRVPAVMFSCRSNLDERGLFQLSRISVAVINTQRDALSMALLEACARVQQTAVSPPLLSLAML